jgi:hypothetical protein
MTAWLSLTQAATRLDVGVRTLRRWLVHPTNPLRSRLRDGHRQIHVNDIDNYARPQMGGKR